MKFATHFTNALYLADQLGQGQKPLQDEQPQSTVDRDEYITRIMEEFNAPGLSLAIINGSNIWAKGYGYSHLPSKAATPSTLYYVASITKSHTAAGIALLVDDNVNHSSVQWTTPLSTLLRDDFVLQDEWATNHVTIQDALSHRTGMPRHDAAYSATQKEYVRNFRNLPMAAEPRTKWMYCNHMYHTIGHLIEVLTGQWVGDFFRERLWEPLGMNSTFLSQKDAANSGLEVATPYWWNNRTQEYQEVPKLQADATVAAGGIRSNVLDYATWVRAMMYNATPMLKSSHDAVISPQMIQGTEPLPAMKGAFTYGFGWDNIVYGGETVITHSGGVDGISTLMAYLPDREWGFVLMSNSGGEAVPIIGWNLVDEFLGIPSSKRANLAQKARIEAIEKLRYLADTQLRVYPSISSPPLPMPVPLSAYTGTYNDAGYGNFSVRELCDDKNATDCVLQGRLDAVQELIPIYNNLTHVSGQYWLTHQIYNFHDQTVADKILRAQFEVGPDGAVERLGADVRMEGEDVPLTWFERISDDISW